MALVTGSPRLCRPESLDLFEAANLDFAFIDTPHRVV